MAAEEVYQRILEHLKKDGGLNTFRLARDLDLDRSRLLNFIEKLEKAGAVEVQHGVVKFLKFVAEEKKAEKLAEAKKIVAKKRKKIKKKIVVPKIHLENKVLKSKAFGTPEAKPLNELKEKILQLESKVEELEKKASAPPKIIKKTIVKEVPVHFTPAPSSPQKKKVKKVKKKPKRKREKKQPKKVKRKSKKKSKPFKFPKFTFMKNIKQLKRPEFAKK